MTKRTKELNKEVLQQAYNAVDASLHLRTMQSISEQVHAIIEAAESVQWQIGEASDFIRNECFDRIIADWPELGMSKKCWLDTVAMRKLQRNKNLSQDFIDKVKRMLDGGKNDTALRDAIIDGFQNNDAHVSVPAIEATKTLQYDKSIELNDDFIAMLDKCVDTREHIDNVLVHSLNQYSQAFEYITGESHRTFRTLLDMWQYRNGGWPTEKTPPRCWGIIAKFRGLHDLLERYDFDMFDDWTRRFGMNIQYSSISPAAYCWGPNSAVASVFAKYTMFKIRDTCLTKYAHLGIQPWHHCILIGELVYAYVWDTREVQMMMPAALISMSDITKDYVDSCAPLIIDTNKYISKDIVEFVRLQSAAINKELAFDNTRADNIQQSSDTSPVDSNDMQQLPDDAPIDSEDLPQSSDTSPVDSNEMQQLPPSNDPGDMNNTPVDEIQQLHNCDTAKGSQSIVTNEEFMTAMSDILHAGGQWPPADLNAFFESIINNRKK